MKQIILMKIKDRVLLSILAYYGRYNLIDVLLENPDIKLIESKENNLLEGLIKNKTYLEKIIKHPNFKISEDIDVKDVILRIIEAKISC